MAVPPPRYAVGGTSGAMAHQVAAVSGGRKARGGSADGMRVPGQVAGERLAGWIKAPSSRRMLPGVGREVGSSPGEAVRVIGGDKPPRYVPCRSRDV